MGLLERHLFRRKFASEALGISKMWSEERKKPLHAEEHESVDQGEVEK